MAKDILKRAVIKEELVKLTGNFALAVTLHQLLYWSRRVKDTEYLIAEELARRSTDNDVEVQATSLKHGWIYKTSEELSQEIMLGSSSTVRRYLVKLIEQKYIFERKNPNPKYKYDKTYHYRVNLVKIVIDLKKYGYVLENFQEFYNEGSSMDGIHNGFQNDQSNNQNGDTNQQIESSDMQNDGAIPENTSNNFYKEFDDEDIKSIDEIYFQDETANKIANYFLRESSKVTLTESDVLSIKQVVQLNLPLKTVTQLIDDCFRCFKPKHERDKIRSFAYVANYIFDKQHQSKTHFNQNKDKIQEEKSNGQTKQSITTKIKESPAEGWFGLAKQRGIIGRNQ